MSEIQELKKEIREHGRRLDNLQSEFNANLLRKEPPTTKPKQGNDDLDAADERLAESIFQASNRRRVSPGREDVSDSNDEDEKLASEIFAASGGNAGDADSTEDVNDEDSRLADELFAASGGNRT